MSARRGHDQRILFSHPLRIIVAAVVLLALFTACFIAGFFFAKPQWQNAQEQSRPIQVWAPVEKRAVSDSMQFAGSAHQGSIQGISINPADQPAILTRQTVTPGNTVGAGTLVAVVSGKPYFGLPAPLPLYRDLKFRDVGDDVMALQVALQHAGLLVEQTGVVDWDTLSAVAALYANAGFPFAGLKTPTDLVINYRAFAALPGPGGTATDALSVGSTVSSDKPVVSIRVGAPYADFIAEVDQADKLSTGDEVIVQAGTQTLGGKVASIGAFQSGKDGGLSGKPVQVSLSGDGVDKVQDGTNVSIQLKNAKDAPTLAVPLTAIRQDNSGSYVQTKTDRAGKNGDSETKRVEVTVLTTGDGYASVTGEIKEGEQVLVS